LEFIIPEHPYGALSLPASSPEERRAQASERLARLAALDPEQLPMALTFLSGYHPRVFDAILDAVEPCTETSAGDKTTDQEPFCLLCGAPVGIFLAHGKDYRHYRGVLTATSKPRPYKADHALVIAWRPTAAAAIPATC
jgi:hypothetical protein